MWYNIFNNILNKHAPIVKKRVKKDRQPEWYNKEISYARKMRNKYHSLGMWAEYRFWRNRTKHIIDTSKQKNYNDMIKDSKDSKTLWKCLHSLNPSNPSKPYELITSGDHKTTDHKEIANTFNNYFTSCVEKLRHSRAPINSNFNTLTNYVQMKFLKKRHNKFIIPPVKVSELFAEITKLDVKTSSGTDNIGPKILKLSAPFIASSLTYIFNRMIDTGIYPSVLKNAKVAPIFKSGEKNVASNYRPISVLPTLLKLIERHVSKHLYKYLTKFDIFHPSQSGFRPNHSCQTALYY